MTHTFKTPLVSAIMPARNASETIVSAIASVQGQSLQDWELIVVDDGSTDDTAAKAQMMAASDSRIRVFRSRPIGRGAARNLCLAHATGKYIAVCDSDDISTVHRFARQTAVLEQDESIGVVSCSRVFALTPLGTPSFSISAPAQHEAVVDELRRGRMPVLFASSMLRSSLFTRLGHFDPALQRCQDFGFFFRHRDQIVFATVPEALLLYRTTGRTLPLGTFFENNLYRRLAIRRAHGFAGGARALLRSLEGIAWTLGAFPLQLVWYHASRAFLWRRIAPLSDDETRLIATAREEAPAAGLTS